MQEASRFVYLLLYFPLLDARRLYGGRGVNVWLFPVLALGGVTILLFLSHYLVGNQATPRASSSSRGSSGTTRGASGCSSATRCSSSSATALLLAELASLGPSRMRVGGLALLIAGTYLSHTRGIWLGMVIVCTGVLLAVFWRDVDARRQRLILRVAAGARLLGGRDRGRHALRRRAPPVFSRRFTPPASGKHRRPSSGMPSSRTPCGATVSGPWCGRAMCETPRHPGPTSSPTCSCSSRWGCWACSRSSRCRWRSFAGG